MLKRTITYEDFDGNQVSEDFYFNMSKSELIELEVEYEDGFGDTLQAIVKANDVKTLIKEFKKLVLLSYGEKSADGKRFVKSDELRTGFSQTPAYDALFMELATNEGAAAEFIGGIMPRDMSAAVTEEVAKRKAAELAAVLPPPPVSTSVDL